MFYIHDQLAEIAPDNLVSFHTHTRSASTHSLPPESLLTIFSHEYTRSPSCKPSPNLLPFLMCDSFCRKLTLETGNTSFCRDHCSCRAMFPDQLVAELFKSRTCACRRRVFSLCSGERRGILRFPGGHAPPSFQSSSHAVRRAPGNIRIQFAIFRDKHL